MTKLKITGRQLIAARALLGLDQSHVAAKLQCSRAAVSLVERGRTLPTALRVVAYLEQRGIEFIRGGVRLRRAP